MQLSKARTNTIQGACNLIIFFGLLTLSNLIVSRYAKPILGDAYLVAEAKLVLIPPEAIKPEYFAPNPPEIALSSVF